MIQMKKNPAGWKERERDENGEEIVSNLLVVFDLAVGIYD